MKIKVLPVEKIVCVHRLKLQLYKYQPEDQKY